MKISKTLSLAVAVAMAFVAGKAMASGGGNLILNISGTALLQATNNGTTKATTKTSSFNEKSIYGIITNALLTASNNSDGAITNYSTPLPANGYLVFNPGGNDGMVQGTFYVEYKTGKTNVTDIPLSGLDTNEEYYSFIELDTFNTNNTADGDGFQFGFYNTVYSYDPIFSGTSAWSLNAIGTGKETVNSTALLYIHDDPYTYDDSDHPANFFTDHNFESSKVSVSDDAIGANQNAVEIRGIVEIGLTIQTNSVSGGTLSLTGSGNLTLANAPFDPQGNLVKSATAKFAK